VINLQNESVLMKNITYWANMRILIFWKNKYDIINFIWFAVQEKCFIAFPSASSSDAYIFFNKVCQPKKKLGHISNLQPIHQHRFLMLIIFLSFDRFEVLIGKLLKWFKIFLNFTNFRIVNGEKIDFT
jgi:hypothetical protein